MAGSSGSSSSEGSICFLLYCGRRVGNRSPRVFLSDGPSTKSTNSIVSRRPRGPGYFHRPGTIRRFPARLVVPRAGL